MDYKISWSIKADKKLESICDYLLHEHGNIVSDKFILTVVKFIHLLHKFQNLGTLENKKHNIRKFVLIKQISIIYQVKKSEIIILNLFDNRQNPKRKKY